MKFGSYDNVIINTYGQNPNNTWHYFYTDREEIIKDAVIPRPTIQVIMNLR